MSRCDKGLLGCPPRLERDWDGNPEIVDVYFCVSHGFFTFRPSRGRKPGVTPFVRISGNSKHTSLQQSAGYSQ